AYFKANHPVQFMAALLTSEMGDTDKIVKYMEECRAMGLQVLPPDVNLSGVQFTVVGGTIRFGLAAIKNVGEAAIQSILATREERGRFVSLADFGSRVDLRLVNRRVIESLIKAGAFDSLGLSRAHLLATLDRAMETGQRRQRDRLEGQGSFFELMGEAGRAPDQPTGDEPPISEWEPDQRLAYEKEVLGFYLSGHPLARFREEAERLGATPIADLAQRPVGARLTLFGHVTALKEIPTKSGERMAFATLEDMGGSVELTVFPGPFRIAASLLRSRQPIVVSGRVDETEKGRVVLAEEVRPLEGVAPAPVEAADPFDGWPAAEPQTCRIRVPGNGGESRDLLESVKRLCGEHPGRVPLFVHLLLPEHEVVVRVKGLRVEPGPALVAKVEALLGQGSVLVE
ncbi:MAG: DNA polymerase III subunit alpha, partial [Candidatus Rokubacteria bacterium]|nr:DNA polymerase III subunit alpha [Candidatus Rokubacteria bacterium]